jgi:hypothetical protein
MDPIAKILYNRSGEKTAVQLSYDEHLRLSDLNREAPLLRLKVKQIAELLHTGSTGDVHKHQDQEPEQSVQPTFVENVAVDIPAKEHEPEQISKPVPVNSLPNEQPSPPVIQLAESSPTPSTAKEYAISIPPILLDFLAEEDPSQKAKRLIVSCTQKLSSLCGKRITFSLYKPYICIWDFDEWKTFAFGEIIQGDLYISVEKTLMPHVDENNVWIPPSGLCKKALARRKVDAITDDLLGQLAAALTHLTKPGTLNP